MRLLYIGQRISASKAKATEGPTTYEYRLIEETYDICKRERLISGCVSAQSERAFADTIYETKE